MPELDKCAQESAGIMHCTVHTCPPLEGSRSAHTCMIAMQCMFYRFVHIHVESWTLKRSINGPLQRITTSS